MAVGSSLKGLYAGCLFCALECCDHNSLRINLHADQGGEEGDSGLLPIGPLTVVVVYSLNQVQLFLTPWISARQAGFPVLHHLLELAQTHVH